MRSGVFIPFKDYDCVGGPSTFMRNLKEYFDRSGYVYKDDYRDVSGIFFPIAYDNRVLDKIKTTGGKVIQRLDGIYYPTKHGEEYRKLNAPIENIYNNYTDHFIFQSEYSKRQCFAMFGSVPEDRYTVIHNGVDTDIFFPASGDSFNSIEGKVKFITTGNFRNADMLEPVINALDSCVGEFDFELFVVGPIPAVNLKPLVQRDYVVWTDRKSRDEIAEYLRSSHIFIYSHLNPPCPNSVLEAIATGLPVTGFSSGSMTELLGSDELLAEVSGDIFQRYEDFKYNKLRDIILKAVGEYELYKYNALKRAGTVSFEHCGSGYMNIIDKIL